MKEVPKRIPGMIRHLGNALVLKVQLGARLRTAYIPGGASIPGRRRDSVGLNPFSAYLGEPMSAPMDLVQLEVGYCPTELNEVRAYGVFAPDKRARKTCRRGRKSVAHQRV